MNRGILGYVIYFWIFQISGFVMFRAFGMVSAQSSIKEVLILFVILGIAYTGFYFIKKNGDAKRARRRESATYDVIRGQKKRKK